MRASCLIGMEVQVLTHSQIGEEVLVAAGSIVPPDEQFPPRSPVIGSPSGAVRILTPSGVETLIRRESTSCRGFRDGCGWTAEERGERYGRNG
jgi:carbonic anhydrase/acetyltransferase-like protein (isoleucine patch superfamily)